MKTIYTQCLLRMSDREVYLTHNSVLMLLLPLVTPCPLYSYICILLNFQQFFMQFLSEELLITSDQIPGNLVVCSWLSWLWQNELNLHAYNNIYTCTYILLHIHAHKLICTPIVHRVSFCVSVWKCSLREGSLEPSFRRKWLSVFGNDVVTLGIFHRKLFFWIVPTCSESNKKSSSIMKIAYDHIHTFLGGLWSVVFGLRL